MKHAERRKMKDSIANQIQDICDRALGQKIVPSRVLAGDYMTVVRWKDGRDEILKLAQRRLDNLSLNKMKKELEKTIELSMLVF